MTRIKKDLYCFRAILIIACLVFFVAASTKSQDIKDKKGHTSRRINFIVSPRQKKIDGAPLSFQLQALLNQVRLEAVVIRKLRKKDFFVIIPGSSREMAGMITWILEKKHAMIGNIWFDSHGHFQKRRSLFEIGNEEFNSINIHDSTTTFYLEKLSPYCDANTKVGIGSCYGGATYTLPAVENIPARKMDGDSLMIGVSNLFNHATVYACKSFVMTSIGIMNAGYAMAGAPLRKKFKDPVYKPVWEHLGEWNCYSGKEEKFKGPLTVSLTQDGSIHVKKRTWLSHKKNRKKLERKLKRFKRGNYDLSPLYQENEMNTNHTTSNN